MHSHHIKWSITTMGCKFKPFQGFFPFFFSFIFLSFPPIIILPVGATGTKDHKNIGYLKLGVLESKLQDSGSVLIFWVLPFLIWIPLFLLLARRPPPPPPPPIPSSSLFLGYLQQYPFFTGLADTSWIISSLFAKNASQMIKKKRSNLKK